MRGLAVCALLVVAAVPAIAGAFARQYTTSTVTATIGRAQAEPGAPGGAKPIDTPVGTDQGGIMLPETEIAKLLASAGAIGLLAVVLFFYRRDFFRKNEREREELEAKLKEEREQKGQLADLVEKSIAAITSSAIATSRQTDATHRLSRAVENIERRSAGLPPVAGGA